ncbi:MAG: c-type cytochrome [Gammaproteobacteria bacterium]
MAQGDPSAGQANSATCVACHSVDGNSVVGMWPKIAGQHEQYLLRQMLEFKKGEAGGRYEPQMLGMVAVFTEQQLADLAAFFAGQTTAPGEAKKEFVALGEKIYRGGILEKGVAACSACHGPQGLGNAPANYPRLSGQHAEYTMTQLKKFRSGERKNDENAIMRMIASKLTDEEIQAVSEYVSGLH